MCHSVARLLVALCCGRRSRAAGETTFFQGVVIFVTEPVDGQPVCPVALESGGGVCSAAGPTFSELPRLRQPTVLHGQLLQRPLHVSRPTSYRNVSD